MNAAKFLITHTFLKEPFGWLLPHKHSFCLLRPTTTFCFFQKWFHIYFPTKYFLGLIYRLGTRVSSILQTLSQALIFNPVEHLRRSFFKKNVNSLKPLSIFAKKSSLVDVRQSSKNTSVNIH